MTTPEDPTVDPAQRALSAADAAHVVGLLEAMGPVEDDLAAILTEPDPDKLIDQVFRDEVHVQGA
jgi:hypothetical protein